MIHSHTYNNKSKKRNRFLLKPQSFVKLKLKANALQFDSKTLILSHNLRLSTYKLSLFVRISDCADDSSNTRFNNNPPGLFLS